MSSIRITVQLYLFPHLLIVLAQDGTILMAVTGIVYNE